MSRSKRCSRHRTARGSVQRAHRVGKRQIGKPRYIVAYFQRYQDNEAVRKLAPRQKPIIQSSKTFFNDEFSQYTVEKRRVLGNEIQKIRNKGNRVWLSHDHLRCIQDGFVYEIPLFHHSITIRSRENFPKLEIKQVETIKHQETDFHKIMRMLRDQLGLPTSHYLNGWQLAKMKKSIPDISLP